MLQAWQDGGQRKPNRAARDSRLKRNNCRSLLRETRHSVAGELRVPIFVPTLFTAKHRMSLAQDASETRELDLLRDRRYCSH